MVSVKYYRHLHTIPNGQAPGQTWERVDDRIHDYKTCGPINIYSSSRPRRTRHPLYSASQNIDNGTIYRDITKLSEKNPKVVKA